MPDKVYEQADDVMPDGSPIVSGALFHEAWEAEYARRAAAPPAEEAAAEEAPAAAEPPAEPEAT